MHCFYEIKYSVKKKVLYDFDSLPHTLFKTSDFFKSIILS